MPISSFFKDIEADAQAVVAWFEKKVPTLAADIEADYKAALTELKTVGETDLQVVVKTIGVAALGGLATGGEAGAIAAGIAAAGPAFEEAEADVSDKTTSILVNHVVSQVTAQPSVQAVTAAGTAGTPAAGTSSGSGASSASTSSK